MKLFTLMLSLLLCTSALANELKTQESTKEFADGIVDLFIQEKFTEGLNAAKPYWPIPMVEIDNLANQINQSWPMFQKRMGKSLGKEFIESRQIGNSLIRLYYLHKFENHSIYWQFDFYKPKNEWKLNSIRFYDSFDMLYLQSKS